MIRAFQVLYFAAWMVLGPVLPAVAAKLVQGNGIPFDAIGDYYAAFPWGHIAFFLGVTVAALAFRYLDRRKAPGIP